MTALRIRLAGVTTATALMGSLMVAAPAAAAPTITGTTAASSVSTAAPAGERNKKVSRSKRGVRPSAYIGKKYKSRYERTRRCIVRKESGGNYRIASRTGKYRGAYQFNAHLASHTARRMGRPDLARKPMNRWSRFNQDKAFWLVWDNGRGRSHWPTARGC
jgi:hypothetical protein